MLSLSLIRTTARWPVLVMGALLLGTTGCGGGNSGGGVGPDIPEAPPTVSLSSSTLEVAAGEGFDLNWTSQNATSCLASGSWQGARSPSGVERIASIASTATYQMQCSNRSASATASVTVQLRPPVLINNREAKVTAEHDGLITKLFWLDLVEDATAYAVDKSMADGPWQQAAQLPGYTGFYKPREWQTTVEGKTRFRIRAVTPRGEFLYWVVPETTYVTVDPDRRANLIVESPEPIRAGTYMNLQPEGWASGEVRYDIDSNFSWSKFPPDFRTYLDTGKLSSGLHWLTARVFDQNRTVATLVHRRLTIDKAGIPAAIKITPDTGGHPTDRRIEVLPYTDLPVGRVTIFVDGVARAVLDQPGFPAFTECCGLRYAYSWVWDVTGLASGAYRIGTVVETTDGARQTTEQTYELRQPPNLTIERPIHLELVANTLTVRGSVEDDVGGVHVTVEVYGGTLPELRCYDDFGKTFSATCDVASLPDRELRVTVEAKNSAGFQDWDHRRVLHSADAASRFTRVFDIENGWLAGFEEGTLLFVDAGRVKLRYSDGKLLDITPPGELFAPATVSDHEIWRTRYLRDRRLQISAGSVAIDGAAGTYVWRDGRTELFEAFHNPVLKWPWLLIEREDGLRLIDLQFRTTYRARARQPDMGFCGHDFHVDGAGYANVYFCEGLRVPRTTQVPTGNIYRYSSSAEKVTPITTDGGYSWPRTDGLRVVFHARRTYVYGVYPQAMEGFEVGPVPYSGKAEIGDGFVAWESGYPGGGPIRVMLPTGAVSDLGSSGALKDLRNGTVLFEDRGGMRLVSWQSGSSRMIVPWTVMDAFVDGPRTIFSKAYDVESVPFSAVFFEQQ